MKGKISKTTVDKLSPCPKDTYLWDDKISGFGVKVTPKGRKVYIFQYRFGGRSSKTRRITIGKHSSITASQARDKAKTYDGDLANGKDPLAKSDAKRKEKSLAEIGTIFITEYVCNLKPRTQAEYKRVFSSYIPNKFLKKSIEEITQRHIELIKNGLVENPYGANRTIRVLSKMFNWAIDNGFYSGSANPCARVKKYKEREVQRYLNSQEFKRLNEELERELEIGTSSLAVYQVAAIRLLCLTGCRLSEILELKWEQVNIEHELLLLPDSKTGSKPVKLNDAAINMLNNIPKKENNPYVICGDKDGSHLVNIQKPWRRIRGRANLEDVRIHDLRHSFASLGLGGGLSLPIIGKLLGHKNPKTTARYAHLSEEHFQDNSNLVAHKIQEFWRES